MNKPKIKRAHSILINAGPFELIKKIFRHALFRLGYLKYKDKEKTFSGWGMETTSTYPPWHGGAGGHDFIGANFLSAHNNFVDQIKNGQFCLTQFGDDPQNVLVIKNDIIKTVKELMWRHYIIYWSSIYSIKNIGQSTTNNLVECGVCDGMGSYFAMSACKSIAAQFKYFMYDAWSEMKEELLLESEKQSSGKYAYLSIDTTKNNLSAFKNHTVFYQGFIPESFRKSDNPQNLVWMHIDLNSAIPTIDALNYFFDKMPKGAVVLFDDYGWRGYTDTKKYVDQWLEGKPGSLFSLPTGQALFFKC